MTHGQIAADKVRISLVISRELKAALEQAAAQDQRSMSNYIVTIITAAMQQGYDRGQAAASADQETARNK